MQRVAQHQRSARQDRTLTPCATAHQGLLRFHRRYPTNPAAPIVPSATAPPTPESELESLVLPVSVGSDVGSSDWYSVVLSLKVESVVPSSLVYSVVGGSYSVVGGS